MRKHTLDGLGLTLVALSTATALPVAAQPSAQTQDASILEEVVVTGERGRARQSISLKRAADGVYDSIVEDDIGRLPDMNVADSLRRLPGASAVLDEDEGRFVTVRGLASEYNMVTIDGIAVATHDAFGGGGRGVNLEVIPNTAVSRLEVFKTFTPDIDGHAVGGYLNLATRSAFDRPGFSIRGDASLGRYTLRALPTSDRHDPEGRFNLTVSNTFGQGDRFGALVSVSYDRKARDETKIIPDGYSYFNAAGTSTGSPLVGNGYAAPNQFRFYIYDDEMERKGLFTRLGARLTDDLTSELSGFFFHQQNAENRYGHQLLSQAGISSQTATTGAYARGVGEVAYSHFPIERRNAGLNWTTTYAPDGPHRLTARLGYSFSDFTHDTPNVSFRTAINPGLGFSYDTSRLIPTFTVNDAAYWTNPDNYALFQYDFRNLRTDEDIVEAKADYVFMPVGGGWGAVAGASYRELTREVDNDQVFWVSAGQRLTGLAQNLNYAPPGRSTPFVFFDYGALLARVAANRSAFMVDNTRSVEASASGDFRYVERIAAAHGAASYTGERFKVIAGVRFENADVATDTFIRETAPTPDVFRPVRRDSSYNSVLPSVNAYFDITDALRLRAAVSRSVGRPNPSSIGQQLSVSSDGLTVTQGNPDLQPRQSDNYDVSLEYTFAGGDGLIALAAFRKDISDEIVTQRTAGTFEGRDVTFVQPVNAHDARVSGVEASLIVSAFDALPAPFDGLGFNGNIALLDGWFAYADSTGAKRRFGQLIAQPDRIANASLFYNWRDRAEVRVAYHFAGRNYASVNTASPWLSRGTPDAEQWDLTVRYDLTPAWTLRFEARNLSDEDQFITQGPDFDQLIEQVDYGRSFWIGLSFRN